MISDLKDRISGNGRSAVTSRIPAISQQDAIKAFEHAGGVLKKSKRGHAVLKMPNGRLVSLPSGELKRGLLLSQIKLGGLTVDTFLEHLKGG